ncbi:MAG: MarR family transcriptional regulator, partial [Phenylobacterium sp.]|nr:MarR family transcriptional regulator [Phenylobacterium sp.]
RRPQPLETPAEIAQGRSRVPPPEALDSPPASAALDAADYQSLGEFRRAIREFLAFSEESARDQGVTSQQHQALLAIRSHAGAEPMSIGELAESLIIKNHSAVGLVARLVERGLVARRSSDTDRRRVLLELQPRGEEVLARISQYNLGKLAGSARSLRRVLSLLKKLETAQSAKTDGVSPA